MTIAILNQQDPLGQHVIHVQMEPCVEKIIQKVKLVGVWISTMTESMSSAI